MRRARFAVKCIPHGTGSLRGETVIDMLAYPTGPAPGAHYPGSDCGLPASAYHYFTANVGQVLSVERVKRGQTRAAARPTQKWKLDETALQEIKDFFGLRLPVYVRRTAGRQTYGTYRLKMGHELPRSVAARIGVHGEKLYHHLTVSGRRSPEKASATVWHELTHAMQAERIIDMQAGKAARQQQSAWFSANREDNQHRYDDRPWEIEARTYEQYAEEIAPCVPV